MVNDFLFTNIYKVFHAIIKQRYVREHPSWSILNNERMLSVVAFYQTLLPPSDELAPGIVVFASILMDYCLLLSVLPFRIIL